MGLDCKGAARLAANILIRRYRCLQGIETWPFWTEKACARADELTDLARSRAGIVIGGESTPVTIAGSLEASLNDCPEFCDGVERNFPELAFAELMSTLALGYVALPGFSATPPEPIRIRLRELVGEKPTPDIVAVALFLHQDVAARLALLLGEALPFAWAQLLELEAINQSRRTRRLAEIGDGSSAEAQLVGLSLSGGGIRSATFNLGILQALADLNLIRYLDYLSTVSGGGYIGSWLHAWIRRPGGAGENQGTVRRALSPKESPDPESSETRPIKWLRRYSNYLAPRLGLLSADILTIATVWMRNSLLNMLVIVLALSAALMVPRSLRFAFDLVQIHERNPVWMVAMLPLVFAVVVIQQNLRSFGQSGVREGKRWFQEQKRIHVAVAFPVLLSAILVAAWLFEISRGGARLLWADLTIVWAFFILLCFVSFGGDYRTHFFDCRVKRPQGRWAWAQFVGTTLLFNGICGLAGALLLFLIERLFEMWSGEAAIWNCLVLGTAAVTMAYALVIVLHLGLFGRNLLDDRREWWSRLGAVLAIWTVGWLAVAGASIYGPLLLIQLANMNYGNYIVSLVGTGWMGTTLAGVLKANSDRTGSGTDGGRMSALIIRLAPPLFVVGLLLLLALVDQFAIEQIQGLGDLGAAILVPYHFELISYWQPASATLGFLICATTAFLLAWRVDVNEFSMHNFYENRLVRCYLGASNPRRQPNRFTGFDPDDDLRIAQLNPVGRDGGSGYDGPYAIVNAALNLVSGEELAWQERKAESFVFTPLFSGYAATPTVEAAGGPQPDRHRSIFAYRPTEQYAFPAGGIRLGRAVAISGAAASPNQGYHTSAAAAFLMTVFNVRLGWWIGNPRHSKGWRRSGPGIGLGYLLVELAAAANNKSKYVYLSDGGHFENLGIYELVRRRCRYIVACDGGQDAGFAFEDLGNAIRKCRSDFGVEIEIDLNSIRPVPAELDGRLCSKAHCAVGIVNYPDAPRGTLVYIKASLTGDEPADVLEYARLHEEFPHQTTADQFFDESQFESYRRLGLHVGTSVFGEIVERRDNLRHEGKLKVDADRAGFFSELRWRWYASSPRTEKSFTRHAEALTALMRRLGEEPALAFLDTQMSPAWERLMKGTNDVPVAGLGLPAKAEERRAGYHFCNALMQLMEDVYLDLNLEEESGHPDNSGWMNLFQHWSWSAMFRATWVISASCYGGRFRNFCENKLGLDLSGTGRVEIVLADGFQDARLNFREKELLHAAGFDQATCTLHLAEVLVQRPDPPHDVMVELTVAIVVVSKANDLVYLRVQEHLRNMGLARRILDAMIVGGQCLVGQRPPWHDLPADYPEPVTQENKERIERLLDSAHMRLRGVS